MKGVNSAVQQIFNKVNATPESLPGSGLLVQHPVTQNEVLMGFNKIHSTAS